MMHKIIAAVLVWLLALAPVASQEIFSVPDWGRHIRVHRFNCIAMSSGTSGNLTIPTSSNPSSPGNMVGLNGMWAILYVGEDAAATWSVSTMTMETVSMTEVIDEDGTGNMNSAAYVSAGPVRIPDSSGAIAVTNSEAITGAVACPWFFVNATSLQIVSSVVDDDAASGALVLTLNPTTLSPGSCIAIGASGNTAITTGVTWAVATEQEDTANGATHSYSTAQIDSDGASMAITSDHPGSVNASGVAVNICAHL